MRVNVVSKSLNLEIPDWLYSYFEIGWMRYEQGLDSFISIDGEKLDSFEEYIVGVIYKLVIADYDRFKSKQRDSLNKLGETIIRTVDKCVEKELLRKKH